MPRNSLRLNVDQYRPFGQTGLVAPPIFFGTTSFGNAFRTIAERTKIAMCGEWFKHVPPPVFIDTAGKYGAGPALEMVGKALDRLEIPPDQVVIHNKLGWKRAPLRGTEPAFEPGVWMNLHHDAVQSISYDGIQQCWKEGCGLLGGRHLPRLVSVHDPDEYLAGASSPAERDQRFDDVLGALRALGDLKQQGSVRGVGVAAMDWRVIKEIDDHVKLDFVMLAGSLTVMRHPKDLLRFVEQLASRQVAIVNSAVFHAGFLVGGRYFDNRVVDFETDADRPLFAWRKSFVSLCEAYGVTPMHACVQFGLSVPGVIAVAVNTSHPDRIEANVAATFNEVSVGLWSSMKEEGLLAEDFPYLG